MKFRYGYRTKDNEKREGVLSASSREDVYAILKREGKKPYLVEPLPGLWNKVQGVGKRGLAVGVLSIIVVGLVLALVVREDAQTVPDAGAFDSMIRRQLIGDIAIIDSGIRTGWDSVFSEDGEKFLASFAVPGAAAGLGSTTEAAIKAALGRKIEATEEDGIEARQIKAMVEGMKQELREFLADGGTIRQYGRRLVQRQEEEISYYNRAKTELETAVSSKRGDKAIAALVERYNVGLRKIGVKPLIMPGSLE